MLNRKGIVFVISAPSGTGKTTICRRIVKEVEDIKFSVSYTTRKKKKDEIEGVDYYFVSKAKFERLIGEGFFVEWANVYGNYYGTPWSELERTRKEGFDLLLEIDVQGGVKVKEVFPSSVLIFVVPPSISTLEERLLRRGRDSREEIKKRLTIAMEEMRYIDGYDYIIENDNLEEAVKNVRCIITSERRKRERVIDSYLRRFGIGKKNELK